MLLEILFILFIKAIIKNCQKLVEKDEQKSPLLVFFISDLIISFQNFLRRQSTLYMHLFCVVRWNRNTWAFFHFLTWSCPFYFIASSFFVLCICLFALICLHGWNALSSLSSFYLACTINIWIDFIVNEAKNQQADKLCVAKVHFVHF